MEFDSEMERTRKLLAAVPEGKWDWQPNEKSMKLGMLSSHIAEMASWGIGAMETDSLALSSADYKPELPATAAELVAAFDRSKLEFRNSLEKASDEDMDKIWSMTWNGRKVVEMPRADVLRSMVLNHMIHHRGQLTVYLRLLGAKVPGLYGPSADEKEAIAS